MAAAAGSSTAIVAASFTERSWNVNKDILELTSGSEEINALIESRYNAINVERTMEQLLQCVGLLQIALVAAKNSAASTPILEVITKFQTLVGDSEIATTKFTMACLKALQLHGMALKAMAKKKPSLAIKMFVKCAEQATSMEGIALELVSETSALYKKAEEALLANQTDLTKRTEMKEKNDRKKLERESKKNSLETKLKCLPEQIESQEKLFASARGAAANEKNKSIASKAIITSMLTLACPPAGLIAGVTGFLISNGGQEQEKMASEAAEEARRLRRDQIAAQAELAEQVKLLEITVAEGHEHKRIEQCLIVCKETLGQIVLRFEAMRLFWHHVAAHCNTLSSNDAIECAMALEDDDEFQKAFVSSGKSWAALGLVSLNANTALVAARESVRGVLENLPRGDEATSKVMSMCQDLQQQIKQNVEEAEAEVEITFTEFREVKTTEMTVTEIKTTC